MSYFGQGNNGRPILLHKTELSGSVSEVAIDNVFDSAFDWHYLVGVDVTIDASSASIRIARRASGSDVTTTLDYMGHRGSNNSANENTMTNQTASYFDTTADQTGTDATRQTNSWVISYIANPTHMPTDWGRILTSGSGAWYGSDGDDWWHERTHQLIGSTGFDGVRIYAASGNIAGGKFLVYGVS